jgi:nucleoporin NUP159
VVPPTVEAVRNTVVKLTGMVEKKSADVEYLEEKVRRWRGRSVSMTPGRDSGTPIRSFGTPSRSMNGSGSMTPVLALVEEGDVEDVREQIKGRKERGRRIREVLEVRAGRRPA